MPTTFKIREKNQNFVSGQGKKNYSPFLGNFFFKPDVLAFDWFVLFVDVFGTELEVGEGDLGRAESDGTVD